MTLEPALRRRAYDAGVRLGPCPGFSCGNSAEVPLVQFCRGRELGLGGQRRGRGCARPPPALRRGGRLRGAGAPLRWCDARGRSPNPTGRERRPRRSSDGYLSAIRGIDRFRGDGSLRGWLHRIVANAALMKLRKRRRHPEESIDELLPSFSPDGHRIDPGPPWRPDEELEGEELRRSVRDCMKRLPAGYREVLVLRDVEEFDTAETAALLEVTMPQSRCRLHRARQALRTLLDAPGSPVRARRRP